MPAYYNEFDRKNAAWLRELIAEGLIAPGEVDERSIEDVTPADLRGFTQHHFFAGIGIWSHSLRLAGWPDDKPVWTGSCPCQPFSAAGKGKGFADERHLWPAWHWLIKQCCPSLIFGEQVANKDGATWFDLVSTDLEGEGYTCGKSVFPACGVGAPHLRQRQYWMAYASSERFKGKRREREKRASQHSEGGSLADSNNNRRAQQLDEKGERKSEGPQDTAKREGLGGMGNSDIRASGREQPHSVEPSGAISGPCPTNGQWRDADWIFCPDGKWRPVEPGTLPLVDGASERVGLLRGYGNAIVAAQAKVFIEVAQEILTERSELG